MTDCTPDSPYPRVSRTSRLGSLLYLPVLAFAVIASADESDEEQKEPWEEELEAMEREAEELERELEMFLEEEEAMWMPMFSIQGGLGYNDNVLRSGVSPDESAFLLTGFDLMLQRVPGAGEPQFNLFLFGENEHFLDNGELKDQRLVSLHAELVADLAPDWELALPADVNYYDDFSDVSTREQDLDTVRFRGVGVHFEPALRYDISETHQLEGQLIGRQVFLSDPLDDYRELGAGFSWEFLPGPDTTFVAEANSVHRRYDTRQALESNGVVIEGRRREFLIHRIEGTVEHHWDSEEVWESRLTGGVEVNRDNGGGYFDFYRPQLSHRLIYRREPWRVTARTGVSHYAYDVRTAGDGNGDKLYRTVADAVLRAEYTVNLNLRLFAEYGHDNVFTNESDADYRVNRAVAGAEWTF